MADTVTDTQLSNGEAGVSENTDSPAQVNSYENEEQYRLPDAKTINEAGEAVIKDEIGKAVAFRSIFEQPGRQLIIFIRHFFCGSCEEYVRALARGLPPSTLSATSPPTTLTIIGCGQPDLIANYRKRTMSTLDKPFDIYCDPTRQLYTKFEMAVNLQMPEKPEYITVSMTQNVLTAMKNGLSAGTKMFGAGKVSQNGGEMIFIDGKMTWMHRMANTADHSEIRELKEVLGL